MPESEIHQERPLRTSLYFVLHVQLLEDNLNGYTTGFSASVLGNIARRCLVARYGGKVEADELCLTVTTGGVLPCGTTARWLPDA